MVAEAVTQSSWPHEDIENAESNAAIRGQSLLEYEEQEERTGQDGC